jgi:hypothetical protein
MKQFKIVPLSEEYAAKIREPRKDDFGHEVIEQVVEESARAKAECATPRTRTVSRSEISLFPLLLMQCFQALIWRVVHYFLIRRKG